MTPTQPIDDTRPPLTSADVTAETLAALRLLLPAAFTEGKLDVARLSQLLGEAAASGPERYGLSWAGKSDAIRAVQSLSAGTLVPAPDESVHFDTSENLILEGDNLEILKLLQKSYHGKVKMIYIDPPYNTGNEFIYPDNFREGLADYLRYSGQVNGEGLKQTVNPETDGRYHSKWLTMMYPRLFLAKNLLRDDGVMFVSIDDHEVHNLRLAMGEIFGEENFVAQISWEKRSGPPNDKIIGSVHEYILVFAKSAISVGMSLLPRTEEDKKRFTNSDDDPSGPWVPGDLSANAKGGRFVASLYYEIENPATGQKHLPPQGACWRFSKDKVIQLVQEGRIYFGSDGQGRPKIKRYLSGVRDGMTVPTIWKNLVTNTNARDEIFGLFGDNNVFETPKPVKLIKRIIEIGAKNGDIIMDFFAGSGTTAQAILELNKEDDGNRKFILTQLPERTTNADYPTIADITKERVRRVIHRLNENSKADYRGGGVTPSLSDAQITFPTPSPPDLGFKVFKLTSSNFKTWNAEDAPKDAAGLAAQLQLYVNNIEPGRSQEDILYELLLKAGLPLTARVEKVGPLAPNSGGTRQEFYSIADGALLVCLSDPILPETLAAMRERRPQRVLCLDTAFHGNDQLKTNTVLEMKSHGIEFRTV